jgi:tetratricopeptide (TPR) repeat protein
MYAGNFTAAAETAESLLLVSPDYYPAYLPVAMSHALRRQYRAALSTYERMGEQGEDAAHNAVLGRTDLALARGNHFEAAGLARTTIAESGNSGNTKILFRQRYWLAKALLAGGEVEAARLSIEVLNHTDRPVSEMMMLGEIYASLGQLDKTERVIETLSNDLNSLALAYATALRAQLALSNSQLAEAAALLQNSKVDLWLNHLLLGQVYLAANRPVEAMDEFETCWERRGEATAVFLDDVPTYHRIVEVLYWQGRTQQAMGVNTTAERFYRDYLAARDQAADEFFTNDARTRLEDLRKRN